ncbi:MAG: hypothetical protein HAW60_01740 [Bdellovibrionales bacterium]|nr:hypothetical protein [Bdellovibrionales bacterium]
MFIKKNFYIVKFFIVFLFAVPIQAQSLICLNLFKDSLKDRSEKIIKYYIDNPIKILVKDSLRLENKEIFSGLIVKSINAEFKDLTIFGKINKVISSTNQKITRKLFADSLSLDPQKNFSIAPIHFLKYNTFIRPTRFITRKSTLFNREYEPSTFLSSLSYAYYFYYLAIEPIQDHKKQSIKKEVNFLISKDYRYASFAPLYNKTKILKNKIKSDNLKKEKVNQLKKELLFMKSRLYKIVLNKKRSYDIFFSGLLKTKAKMLDNFLHKPLVKTKDSQKAITFLKNISKKLPALFLELDQALDKDFYINLGGFKKLNKKNIQSAEDKEKLKTMILIKIVKKHIYQETIRLMLYFTQSERSEFFQTFPWVMGQIISSKMYSRLNNLYKSKEINEGQFLRSMQEFIQWKFNFSIWRDLGLQRFEIGKNTEQKVYYTNKILTLKKIKQNILKTVKDKI